MKKAFATLFIVGLLAGAALSVNACSNDDQPDARRGFSSGPAPDAATVADAGTVADAAGAHD